MSIHSPYFNIFLFFLNRVVKKKLSAWKTRIPTLDFDQILDLYQIIRGYIRNSFMALLSFGNYINFLFLCLRFGFIYVCHDIRIVLIDLFFFIYLFYNEIFFKCQDIYGKKIVMLRIKIIVLSLLIHFIFQTHLIGESQVVPIFF